MLTNLHNFTLTINNYHNHTHHRFSLYLIYVEEDLLEVAMFLGVQLHGGLDDISRLRYEGSQCPCHHSVTKVSQGFQPSTKPTCGKKWLHFNNTLDQHHLCGEKWLISTSHTHQQSFKLTQEWERLHFNNIYQSCHV